MNGKTKNKVIALVAGAAALCLGGAVVCNFAPARPAFAAAPSYEAFIDIGANADAAAADTVLGLSEKGASATQAGTVTEGGTMFASSSTGAAYKFTVSAAGEYQIAVALKAEAGKTLTVAGDEVPLTGKSGNCVVSVEKNLSSTEVDVSYDGDLCGVLISAKGGKILMTADYAPGQVVRYGALLADQLDGATACYSDGSTADLPITYGEINAGTGINVNFTTIDVEGTVEAEGVEIPVKRYLTTMPDDLVYFINCGSSTEPEPTIKRDDFNTEAEYQAERQKTIDSFYSYNQTVFDYYGKSLLNYGTPNRTTQQGGDWGYYTQAKHFAPGDATFPYNSALWTGGGNGTTDMGYMLSGLDAAESYRIWFGTLSHWHGRTSNITFNGEVADNQPTISIGSSKGFTIFKNVKPDANGKLNIHLTQVGSQNEPTLCFIAVQKMSTELPAAPAAPQGPTIVGMEDTSIKLTSVAEGAKIQLYNAEKPNQLIYEEMVDGSKIGADGSYELTWGEVLDLTQFRIVQLNAGGVSSALLVSITDIKDFKAYYGFEGYTTGNATVCVEAVADSGIASWSYRLGEYGAVTTVELNRPYKLEGSFEAAENGTYYIVITSGLGVTYSETFTVDRIDASAPAITLTPSKDGWQKGAYNVTLAVSSVAPVTEYKLLRDGKVEASATEAPASICFKETGEYTVFVKTASGQSSVQSLRVSERPVTVVVNKKYERRQLSYVFGDSTDYTVRTVTAYQLQDGAIVKMTISDGNAMDVYDQGTYIVTATAKDGSVEMFALSVAKADFSAENTGVVSFGGNGGGTALGVGLGVGIGGVALAAVAVVLTLVLTKKKRS